MNEEPNEQAPSAPVEVSARLQQQRAALAKARAAPRKPKAPVRKAEVRTVAPRTAADARVGVSAHPEPAERRDAPVRESMRPGAEVQLTRRPRSERTAGMLEVPKHLKKPGWDYQYITLRVLNQPVDPSDIREFYDQGWRPVTKRDMPEMADRDAPDDMPIESRGQRLMTRPQTLTNQAKEEDLQYAQEQQRDRTMAAASGRSAVRGHEGIADDKAVRRVPLDIVIEGLAG